RRAKALGPEGLPEDRSAAELRLPQHVLRRERERRAAAGWRVANLRGQRRMPGLRPSTFLISHSAFRISHFAFFSRCPPVPPPLRPPPPGAPDGSCSSASPASPPPSSTATSSRKRA